MKIIKSISLAGLLAGSMFAAECNQMKDYSSIATKSFVFSETVLAKQTDEPYIIDEKYEPVKEMNLKGVQFAGNKNIFDSSVFISNAFGAFAGEEGGQAVIEWDVLGVGFFACKRTWCLC